MTTQHENPMLRFELSLEQANTVLQALGRLPYEQVYRLIDEIQRQAAVQMPVNPGSQNPQDKTDSSN